MSDVAKVEYGWRVFDAEETMHQIRRSWGWLMALGIALCVIGMIAISAAGIATLASVVVFGSVLIVSGGIQVIHAFSFRIGHGFLLNLLMGILYTVVGLLMMARPDVGAVSLTLLMASFFLFGGIFRAVWSAVTRLPFWGWSFVSGLISAGLGLYVAVSLPVSAIWLIGTFIGIELLFSGWSWIMLSLAARSFIAEKSIRTVEADAGLRPRQVR